MLFEHSLRALKHYCYGEREIRWLNRLCRPDMASLDIGANTGTYTWWMARYSMVCYAFEPNPQLAIKLRGVSKNVKVLEYALSDEVGAGTLYVPEKLGLASLSTLNEEMAALEIAVEITTIDALELPLAGFVKIDVEGFEINVLDGARRYIEQCRPRVLVEVEERHRQNSVADVFSWFSSRDFQGIWFKDGKWRPVSDFQLARDQDVKALERRVGRRYKDYVNNFLFLPSGDALLRDLAPSVSLLHKSRE